MKTQKTIKAYSYKKEKYVRIKIENVYDIINTIYGTWVYTVSYTHDCDFEVLQKDHAVFMANTTQDKFRKNEDYYMYANNNTEGVNMKKKTKMIMSDEAVQAVKIRQGSIGVEPVQAIKTGDSLLVLEKFISEKPNVAYGEYMTVDGFIGTVYKLADGSFSDYMTTTEMDKHFADSPLSTPSIISDKADRQACIELAKLYSPLCYLTSTGDYNRAKKALIDYAKSLTLHQQQRLDSMLNEHIKGDGANISSTLDGEIGVNING